MEITSGVAGQQIQKLLNNEFGGNLSTDGVIGSKIIEAMNNVEDSAKLTRRIADIRKDYYWALTESDPKNLANIKGWVNRVNRCAEVVIK
ncbi:putative peptidoglycan-binding domain-containing protein [Brenneria goodwinii]|uniref:putative peptidoglycan-binding domain-containing protein n=1 Tax=Brenneria goodwinii TaxID=1109412 RepID=UPI0036F3C77F